MPSKDFALNALTLNLQNTTEVLIAVRRLMPAQVSTAGRRLRGR
jgi:hypothetical protein